MAAPTIAPYNDRWHPDQIQQCVDLWGLTGKEQSQLLQLKERIADIDHWANSPFEVVRFVLEHTCHSDVDIMERRVRHCVEWRREHHLDSVLEEYAPPILLARFPGAIMQGTDKDGDVLCVVRSGASDPLELLHRFGKDELIQAIYWGGEFAIRGPWHQDLPRRPKQATAVIDLKGLNWRHYHPSVIFLFQKLGHSLQLHYPHVAKKVLVVNAPAIFRYVWTIFKPFVMPHLRALMEVATEHETEQILREYMDLSVLPRAMLPGKGLGEAVRGLDPDWEGLLPPSSSDDWKRIPLVYGHDSNKEENSVTISLKSSLSRESVEYCSVHISAKLIITGTWESGGGIRGNLVV